MSDSFLVNHDLHCHTFLSSCSDDENCTAAATFALARDRGYDTVCITDHLWDADVPGASPWYAPQDIEHVLSSRSVAPASGVRCLIGCETEYVGGGRLGLAREHFDLFDFVVIPPNHMHMKGFVRPAAVTDPDGMAELFTQRLEEISELDIPMEKVGIAHLTCSLLLSEGSVADVISRMDGGRLARAFDRFARRGAGIELNADSFKQMNEFPDETLRLYRIALDSGCKFYCASDAHTIAEHAGYEDKLKPVVRALGLKARDRYEIPG